MTDRTTDADGASAPPAAATGPSDHPTGTDGRDPAAVDEYAAPPDADPAVCERCGRPFVDGATLALHRGLDHGDLSAEERSAFETAYDRESDQLRRFRLVSVGALVVLYFGLLMTYALVA